MVSCGNALTSMSCHSTACLPIPSLLSHIGVAYKRLEQEIFCHNYYLRNLCDETRFPDWPIVEPVEVFRACLERFKQQVNVNRSSDDEAIERARVVLKLQAGDGSKELRKAYRSQARLFHPDKVRPTGPFCRSAVLRKS